jgi:hypothetical protein
VAAVFVVLVLVALGWVYFEDKPPVGCCMTTTMSTTSSQSVSTDSTNSTNSTSSNSTILLAEGTTFQVSSSFDCVAGNFNQTFSVNSFATLQGGISAAGAGVTLYVSTAQQAQTLYEGHPSMWFYSSGLSNSTSFSFTLVPGSFVFWVEGADMGCIALGGGGVVEPLEMLTNVTVTQAVTLVPQS